MVRLEPKKGYLPDILLKYAKSGEPAVRLTALQKLIEIYPETIPEYLPQLADAEYQFAKFIQQKPGPKKDWPVIVDLYTRAAGKGDGNALFDLAVIRAKGTVGGQPDWDDAAHCVETLVQQEAADDLAVYRGKSLHFLWESLQSSLTAPQQAGNLAKAYKCFRPLIWPAKQTHRHPSGHVPAVT